MCMQDLVINRSLTWRRVSLIEGTGGAGHRLPSSPIRVAVMGFDVNTPSQITWRLPDAFTDSQFSVYGPYGAGTGLIDEVVTIAKYPGIFNNDLMTQGVYADLEVFECVMDTPLSLAVQAEYEKLVGR